MNGTMMRWMAVELVAPHCYHRYNVIIPKPIELKSWAEVKGKRHAASRVNTASRERDEL